MHLPEEKQKELRKGTNFGQNIFTKGRWPKPGEKKRFNLEKIIKINTDE